MAVWSLTQLSHTRQQCSQRWDDMACQCMSVRGWQFEQQTLQNSQSLQQESNGILNSMSITETVRLEITQDFGQKKYCVFWHTSVYPGNSNTHKPSISGPHNKLRKGLILVLFTVCPYPREWSNTSNNSPSREEKIPNNSPSLNTVQEEIFGHKYCRTSTHLNLLHRKYFQTQLRLLRSSMHTVHYISVISI